MSVDDAVSTWLQSTLTHLDAEAKEEQARIAEVTRKGKTYRARIAAAERGIAGNTLLSLEGRAVGATAADLIPRGVPVMLETGGEEALRGVSCAVKETTLKVSIESDDWDHQKWMDASVNVVPLRTDVTTKAMRAALLGGGMGYGTREDDTPPLQLWRQRSSAQQRVVAMAHDDSLADLLPAREGAEEGGEQEEGKQGEEQHYDFFAALNPHQEEAVRCCHETPHPVHLILGPPGTGKTETVCEVIRQAVLRAQRVLVATPSNIAADNIVERLCLKGPAVKKLRCVRVGHSSRLPETLQPFSLDARMMATDAAKLSKSARTDMQKLEKKLKNSKSRDEKREMYRELRALTRDVKQQERKKAYEVIGQANVVVGTLVNTTQAAIRQQSFDLIVIDEACQALEAAAWVVASRADKIVLAGDPFQLPPTVLSDAPLLKVTLFERLYARHKDSICTLLETQYRMNTVISDWSSNEFYGGRMHADASVAEHLVCELHGVEETEETETPALLIDTSHADLEEDDVNGSKRNSGEAQVCAEYVERLVAAGVPVAQIAVISPYSAQVATLREVLDPGVEVGTVDSYQGREKEVVIISLVRSNARGEIGFLSDYRRLNVAVTRARRHVAVVCNPVCLRHDAFLKRLIDYFEDNAVVQLPE